MFLFSELEWFYFVPSKRNLGGTGHLSSEILRKKCNIQCNMGRELNVFNEMWRWEWNVNVRIKISIKFGGDNKMCSIKLVL